MKKIFIAVVAVGICFEATSVKAAKLTPSACQEISELAFVKLAHYRAWSTSTKKATEEAARLGTLSKNIELLQKQGAMAISFLGEGSNLATIYTAFCKK